MKAVLLSSVLIAALAPAAAEAGPAARLARQLGITRSQARQMLSAPYGARSANSVGTAAGQVSSSGTGVTQGIAGFGSVSVSQ